MIASFAHKGLERLSRSGCPTGVMHAHIPRLKVILSQLKKAKSPFDIQGLAMHSIARSRGNERGNYSVKVNANWRVTFRFNPKTQSMDNVDYVDYH